MTILTRSRRQAREALHYHRQQLTECNRTAWVLVEDGLQDTRAYRDLQREIERHQNLITAISREFGDKPKVVRHAQT